MSPSDIVDAAIALGVRVERVVDVPGGEPVTMELHLRGGRRDGGSSVFAGLDCDGVEWKICVMPGGGVPVIYPATPGATPSEQARFSRMIDARDYAAHIRARRRDLTASDIRLGDPLIEYAGPTR